MFFSNNIKLLRKRRGRTQDDIAFSLDMKRSTLSGYENNIAQPNVNVLVSFSDFFNIAIDTLIRIDLQELSNSQLTEIENGFDIYIKGSKLRVLTTTVDDDNFDNTELVSHKARAGYTNGYADPEYVKELPSFSMPFLSRERKYRTFQISGDSMLPIIDGSYITGEYIDDWRYVKTGTPAIILTKDDGIVFKIIENNIESNKTFKLHSLNKEYEPYEIKVNEVREIWKFKNYISSEMPDANSDLKEAIEKIEEEMKVIKDKLNGTI